jgi:hypothetical protein
MLGGSPCHHSVARPRVADGRDSLQQWRVAVIILNKKLRTNDKKSVVLRSQIGLQHWKIWTLGLKLKPFGKRLERISKFQPKRV